MRGGGSKIFDTDDNLLMTIPPGMTGNIEALSEKYGKAPFFLGWHEIRHLLYESLPDGVVEFDKQVCHAITQCACPASPDAYYS